MFIWFQLDPNNNRLDQIMFFADGDFQSIQTYNTAVNPIIPAASGSPVVSNLARIYYGQAQNIDRVLSRRQYLSIANPAPPNPQYWQFPLNVGGVLTLDPSKNDWFEHDTNSLSQWQAAVNDPINGSTNVSNIITGCFGTDSYFSNHRPQINLADANTLHLLMAQKVGNFSVQWSYLFTNAGQTFIYWWPSIDPDGNGDLADSDFGTSGINLNQFGFHFNTAASSFTTSWFTDSYAGTMGSYYLTKPSFPQALKFTFTLYDSRGVFKDGQTFTHIVYLGD
jgi:hypothetical protein